jgi:hypothetical protein
MLGFGIVSPRKKCYIVQMSERKRSLPEKTIMGASTIIEQGSIEAIRNLVPRNAAFRQTWEILRDNYPDAQHPLGQLSTVTTLKDPAVIFDDGAASCSPILTFDKDGNALHFHDSMAAEDDGNGNYGKEMDKYFDFLPKYVGREDTTLCIAGLNRIVFSEEKRKLKGKSFIDIAIEHVDQRAREIYPSIDIVSFISKWSDDQEIKSPFVPDKTDSRGMIFVPKYIANDGKNHLLTVLEEKGSEIIEELGIPHYG